MEAIYLRRLARLAGERNCFHVSVQFLIRHAVRRDQSTEASACAFLCRHKPAWGVPGQTNTGRCLGELISPRVRFTFKLSWRRYCAQLSPVETGESCAEYLRQQKKLQKSRIQNLQQAGAAETFPFERYALYLCKLSTCVRLPGAAWNQFPCFRAFLDTARYGQMDRQTSRCTLAFRPRREQST